MTDFFYVGATGNWQGGTVWALTSGGTATAQTPTSTDNVFFDSHSTGTVTVGTASACANFTMTAPGAGTITMGATAVLSVAGNMTCATGMTFAPNSSATINLTSTSGSAIITTAGYILPIVNFNGVSAAWTLQDNFKCSGNCTLTNVTFTAPKTVTFNPNANSTTAFRALSGTTITIYNLTLGTAAATAIISGSWTIPAGGKWVGGVFSFSGTATGGFGGVPTMSPAGTFNIGSGFIPNLSGT